MVARWDKEPPRVTRRASARRAPTRGKWRCCGRNGCGEIVDGTWASAERHADEHGGARLEQCIGDDE